MSTVATSCDVAIVGGGPAGSAAALALRRHAPDLGVALFEAGTYDCYRAGEIVASTAGAIFSELSVLSAIGEAGFPSLPTVRAAWERPQALEEHALFSARGSGWIVERSYFDQLLSSLAAERGASVAVGCRVATLARSSKGWLLRLRGGARCEARFLILATGRDWGLIRNLGGRLQVSDRLVGRVRVLRGDEGADRGLMIEAAEDGWWYSAPIGRGVRVMAWMTDADLSDPSDEADWAMALAKTQLMREMAKSVGACAHAALFPAMTTRMRSAAGAGWVAAGDVAAAFDPLSAQGVTKALRAGLFAAYAAADALAGRAEACDRFAFLVERECEAYAKAYRAAYQSVYRWPESPFWSRRAQ
ncbi:FAD-dependent monooxygenase [Breoghania sp. L-A4]|uniref:FAD-dependent monooxygenase n=1 Tax=Breoghania sp. L-A4 TaxID=2304600 RepID=UPI0013C35CA3|nr:FAD-dependent monooxygenase [Breoghania sp. L-A4]